MKGAGTLWETALRTQTDPRRRGRPCNTLFPVLRKEPTNCHLTEHTAVPNGLLEIGALLDVMVRRSVILAHEAVISRILFITFTVSCFFISSSAGKLR